MYTLLSVVAGAILASTANGTPVPAVVQMAPGQLMDPATGRLGVTVLQAVARMGKSGPQAYAAMHRKYEKTIPANVKAAAAADDSVRPLHSKRAGNGSVVANPESYDVEYLCPVYVGTPAKLLNINFDTGSADLWMFSSLQPSSQSAGHDLYTPTSSTTSKEITGASWNIQYGDGSSATGVVYNDTVMIGGVTVTTQAVEAATSVSAQFQQNVNSDGLMGLAFSSLNTVRPQPRTTWFETAVSQNRLINNLFTADLKKAKPGSYGFGQIDSTKYTGTLTYTTLNKAQGYWGFTASGYGVGGTFTASSIAGIADTGSTLLTLPSSIVSAYWSKVSGAAFDNNYGAYTFPCSAALPTFTIGIGTGRYTLPGTYLNYGPVSQTTCYGGLQSSDGMGINIFGDIFLKGVFVVFDYGASRIGFATKNLP